MKSSWSDLFVRPIPRTKDTSPQHWKLLIFYYNPADSRLFVPRRWTGTPFTLNFARPSAWIAGIVLLIALIVLMPFNHDILGFARAIRQLVAPTSR